MDEDLNTLMNTQLTNFMKLFLVWAPDKKKANNTAFIEDSGIKLAYSGACLAFFLSIAGVFTAGSSVIKELETSYFSFLEDYQDDDGYIALMDDDV